MCYYYNNKRKERRTMMTQKELKDINLHTLTREFNRAASRYRYELGYLKSISKRANVKEETIDKCYKRMNIADDKMNAILIAITVREQDRHTEFYLNKFSSEYEDLANRREALM